MLTTDEKIENILENLKFDKNFIDKIEYINQKPSKKGKYGYIKNLNPKLTNFLHNRTIRLFKHQCEVFELVKDGKNVIITTPTASGKTLAFTLPVLDILAEDKNAMALYIYPAKALSSNQLQTLKEYEKETKIKIKPHKYDHDVNSDERALARSEARIIITNPHMIHNTLFWHFKI